MQPIESFDQLAAGQDFDFGTVAFAREELLEFAHRWDPQPFHIDEAAAARSVFGGLIASGMYTQVATCAHILRSGLWGRTSLGGLENVVRWPAPVRPGDVVAVTGMVLELVPSRSRSDRGIAKLRYLGHRQPDGTLVLEMLVTHVLRR